MELPADIKRIIEKAKLQQASSGELAELMEWLRHDPDGEQTIALQREWGLPENIAQSADESSYWKAMAERILEADRSGEETARHGKVRKLVFRRWVAAASVLVLMFLSAYYFMTRKSQQKPPLVYKTTPADKAPGIKGATLTLDDGRQIILDTMKNGVLAYQQGREIVLHDGQVRYAGADQDKASTVYNTMTTGNGRQFQLQLPDGSKVWLNAASSIRYPTSFHGETRNVEITGEVYMEVAADKSRPFIVEADNRATIAVLGTHFNINAYRDESFLTTTLLEGAVKVTVAGESRMLVPGQQAKVKMAGAIEVVRDVHFNQVLAWKNGLFNLENMRLQEIMRQLERWYDIKVQYQGQVPDISFNGQIDRGVNLSEMLNFFRESGIPVQFDGNILTVIGK